MSLTNYVTLSATAGLIALGSFTSAAFAQDNQPDLSDLILDTNGYVNVRDDVVILEGDDYPTFMCKFDASDAAFDNYKRNGDIGGEQSGYTCIPIEGFEDAAFAQGSQPDLSDLILDTNGYVNVRDDVVILEGDDYPTFMCKFDAGDAAFDNYKRTGDVGGEQIGYTCIPIEEFEN